MNDEKDKYEGQTGTPAKNPKKDPRKDSSKDLRQDRLKLALRENRRRGGEAMSRRRLPMAMTSPHMTTAQKSRANDGLRQIRYLFE
jgi:hypothetical protein